MVNSSAVLLAVLWPGVESVLRQAGADEGALDGIPLIDPTNAVEHGVGMLLTPAGVSAAQHIAELAPGARVVKAFNMFPADQWVTTERATDTPVLVPLCGDDSQALELVSGLVRDVGAMPAVLGSLPRARQLEEAAGFVIGLAFAGSDPSAAIPRIPLSSDAKAGR
jgi:8-hydroxy-5-deazaflavin:NADPH oxidoreductase